MTLSQWFRDYLYIPLGGNRHGAVRTYADLAAVFLLCGLWHGAAWNFVAWGAWHGLFLVLERAGLLVWPNRIVRHVYLLLVVIFGWVLFRADGIGHAAAYMAAMLGGGTGDPVLSPGRGDPSGQRADGAAGGCGDLRHPAAERTGPARPAATLDGRPARVRRCRGQPRDIGGGVWTGRSVDGQPGQRHLQPVHILQVLSAR